MKKSCRTNKAMRISRTMLWFFHHGLRGMRVVDEVVPFLFLERWRSNCFRLAEYVLERNPGFVGRVEMDVRIMSDCAGLSSETWGLKHLWLNLQ